MPDLYLPLDTKLREGVRHLLSRSPQGLTLEHLWSLLGSYTRQQIADSLHASMVEGAVGAHLDMSKSVLGTIVYSSTNTNSEAP